MPVWCMITEGNAAADREAWLGRIAKAVHAGAGMIQIREKQLEAGELLDLTRSAIAAAGAATVIVNSRVDVAIAAGAAGVHLPADAVDPTRWRAIAPAQFLIGVSCHTLAELRQAEREGASYAIFGPVFAPLSKTSSLAPRGLEGLRTATRSVRVPLYAVGGITRANAVDCFETGAAGVAAISLYRS